MRPLPLLVVLVAKYLRSCLKQRRAQPCARRAVPGLDPWRIDAKAEGQLVVLGGWEPVRDAAGKLDKGASRWFSVELTKDTAPWAYERDGQPFRVIAALEAMASLVSFVLFAPEPRTQSGPATVVTVLPEFTDNRGSSTG